MATMCAFIIIILLAFPQTDNLSWILNPVPSRPELLNASDLSWESTGICSRHRTTPLSKVPMDGIGGDGYGSVDQAYPKC